MPCSGPTYLTNYINHYVDSVFDLLEDKPKSCLNHKFVYKLEHIIKEVGIHANHSFSEALLYGTLILLIDNPELDREECRKVLQEVHVIIENSRF